MTVEKKPATSGRRKFLTGAAAATTGAATLGFPMIGRTQSPIVIKMQGAWSSTDIFNEFAMEFVNRVNEMAGGRLRIDYLVGGAVVKPFEVTDAVSKGVLDAGHTVPVYWYGKSKVRRSRGRRLTAFCTCQPRGSCEKSRGNGSARKTKIELQQVLCSARCSRGILTPTRAKYTTPISG